MHVTTQEITGNVLGCTSLAERMHLLHNAYKDETAFIVSCGPSVSDVLVQDRLNVLKGRLVLAIKQSYDLLPHYVDHHILTNANLKKYSYANPILVFKTTLNQKAIGTQGHQNTFGVISGYHNKYVNKTHLFAEYEFTKSLLRPVGPGVMSELGLYLPVHFGCKRIVVIGWDVNLKELRHFYDKGVKQMDRYKRESILVHKAVPAMLTWLKSRGVELLLCSPRSALKIPQVPVKEFASC